jgi:hypothetical protein
MKALKFLALLYLVAFLVALGVLAAALVLARLMTGVWL